LSSLLQEYLGIKLDNEPNPLLGFILLFIGILFWLYVEKKSNKPLKQDK
jgi:hypothetical protein